MREAELICSKVKRKNGDLTAEWKLGKTGETFMGCYDGNINICFSSKIATSKLYLFVSFRQKVKYTSPHSSRLH